jgi:hypothetical protein
MENQINTDGQNNQIITENSVSGVSQKLKEPRIIIFVVLLVILSLGGIFAGIYYRQKQILTNQERKTVESQKSDNVLNNTKVSPFLEILDTNNQIPVESKKEPTAIAISGGLGCQPDFFDPQTTKYEYLQQTEETGSYWNKDIYQVRGNDYNYKFSINTISAPPYTITDYEFGCASSFDHVLDIRKDNKRISLYTHVNTFYLNDDKSLLFLDNYLKNQKGAYDHKRRIISIDGTKKTDIPSIDCVSRWANWTSGHRLITYSDQNVDTQGLQGKEYNDYQTKVCIWDNNGNLLYKLRGKLTWYGANSNMLWGLLGLLPKEQNVFFAYDMDTTNSPHQCSIFLQDLNVQKKHKTIALFPEEGFNRDLCPNAPFIELDLLNTTFENPMIRFRVNDGVFGAQDLYANFRNWRIVDKTASSSSINNVTANWRTYSSIDNSLMFKYPVDWEVEKESVFGSRTVTEFKYKNTPLFELTLQGNYNQITGKPHNSLNEFLGPRLIKSKDIFIDGHAAKKIEDQGEPGHVIPYEEAIVFTPDNKAIVSLNYTSSYYDKPTANGILDQILSTFKFSGTNWGDWQTSTMTNNDISNTNTKAIQMLQAISEVQNIERTVSHAGRKLFYTPEGVNGDVVRVSLRESLPDDPHTSRIDTFNINIKTKIITVEDVVTGQDISLEEWKKKVNQSWGF